MKKLLYITTNIQNSGGVARVLSVRLNYLANTNDYEIHILNTNGSFKETFYQFNNSIHFHHIGNKKFGLLNIQKYKKALRLKINEITPQIIINTDNGLKGSLLPYLINKKPPLIYERHCGKDLIFDKKLERLKFKLGNYLTTKSLKFYNRFVVLNDFHAKEWKTNNIYILPNPVTTNQTKKDGLNREKKVLAVGRFSKAKNYATMLDTWSEVVRKNPDWKLEIYGAGDSSYLNESIKKLEISSSVSLNEAIKNIEEKYSAAAILVSTSVSEAFPLSVIEALHLGLPVVAFQNQGNQQLIKNDENGLLIAQNDKVKFVEAIEQLITSNKKREEMGHKAIESTKKYKLENVMSQWIDLFEECLNP